MASINADEYDASDDAPLLSGEFADDDGASLDLGASGVSEGGAVQSRVQTVASIVNTMMGTTILALPYGVAQCGIGAALAITGVLGAVSCFTCLVVVERGLTAGREDFSGSVEAFLGARAKLVAWGFSVAIILGASIVYHILMAETLYALVATVLSASGHAAGGWSRAYAALVPWAIYPVCNLQNLSALVRFNSVGFLFLGYTVVFICFHGAHALAARGVGGAAPIAFVQTLPAGASPWASDGTFRVVTLGAPAFAGLGGMMMLSFFLHNVVQPIIKNANPKTRSVDIALGYLIAGTLYSIVGVLGYIGFADAHTQAACATGVGGAAGAVVSATAPARSLSLPTLSLNAPAPPGGNSTGACTLSSDFLASFSSDLSSGADAYAFSARVALLLQLLTVFPILLLIIRGQVCTLLVGTPWPGAVRVAALNGCVMALTTLFAALDLQINDVLRFVGAVGGFVIVFAVPVGMEAVARLRTARGEPAGGAPAPADDDSGEGGLPVKLMSAGGLPSLPLRTTLWLAAILAIGATFCTLQFVPGLSG